MLAFLALLIAALGFAGWWAHRWRLAAAAEMRAQKEATWLLRMAQQKWARERLLTLNEESLSLLESMPGWVGSAETYLDQAEIDFTEGAFAPFWSSVERAVICLARFDESVQRIESNSSEYLSLIPRCKGPLPPFAVSTVSPIRMRLAADTSHRLQGIVRRAQRDFQFSVIYEHRKTSQILVAGFKNLADAVEDMATQITSSIDNLTHSVESMTTVIDESLQRLTKEKRARAAGAAERLVEPIAAAETRREQKVLDVLHHIEETRYRSALPVV